jgi:hypothetical protein
MNRHEIGSSEKKYNIQTKRGTIFYTRRRKTTIDLLSVGYNKLKKKSTCQDGRTHEDFTETVEAIVAYFTMRTHISRLDGFCGSLLSE